MEITDPYAPFVADLLLKGAFILTGGFVLAGLLRKVAAKWRHLVWTGVMFGLFFTTVYVALKPIPKPEYSFTVQAAVPHFERKKTDDQAEMATRLSGVFEFYTQNKGDKTTVEATVSSPSLGMVEYGLLLIWFCGVVWVLFGIIRQTVLLRRLRREAQRVTSPELLELTGLLKIQLKIRRPVTLIHHSVVLSPMTWGAFRPVILLPSGWLDESDDSHEMMLLHELSHVRRWDYPIHQLAQVLSALHWPNPLVWLARRQMLTERERACDDVVLQNGIRPSDYAGKLVDLARNMLGRSVAHAGLGMAHVSELKVRVNAILHESEERLLRLQWGAVLAMMALLTLTYTELPLRLNGVTHQMRLLEWATRYRALHGGFIDAQEQNANAPLEERILGPTEETFDKLARNSALSEQSLESANESKKDPLLVQLEKFEEEGLALFLQGYDLLKNKIRAFVNPANYPNETRIRLNEMRAKLYGMEPQNAEISSLLASLKATLEEGGRVGTRRAGMAAKIQSLYTFLGEQEIQLEAISSAYNRYIQHVNVQMTFATKDQMEAKTEELVHNRPKKNSAYVLRTLDRKWENTIYVGPLSTNDPVILRTLITP